MKKVLFMFVAVLALASCQKGADKSSEAAASDSAKTEAVEEKSAEAEEVKAPEKTGDVVADLKASLAYILSKVKACKSMDDLMALEKDPAFQEFENLAKEAEAKVSPEQKKELEEFFKLPENNIEKAMEEKMKEFMSQK